VGVRTRPPEEELVRQEQFIGNGGIGAEIEAESDEVGRGAYGIILSPWDAGLPAIHPAAAGPFDAP
jgi:hypothetical protein